jgi:hypothetical protein
MVQNLPISKVNSISSWLKFHQKKKINNYFLSLKRILPTRLAIKQDKSRNQNHLIINAIVFLIKKCNEISRKIKILTEIKIFYR